MIIQFKKYHTSKTYVHEIDGWNQAWSMNTNAGYFLHCDYSAVCIRMKCTPSASYEISHGTECSFNILLIIVYVAHEQTM